MDAQTQEKIYITLFRIWRSANTSAKIHPIPENDRFIDSLQALVADLNANNLEAPNDVIKSIYQKTVENIRFMLKDMLELRGEKILRAAREFKKIEEKYLLTTELNYYQALIPAFKGYSKGIGFFLEKIPSKGKDRPMTIPAPNTSERAIPSPVAPAIALNHGEEGSSGENSGDISESLVLQLDPQAVKRQIINQKNAGDQRPPRIDFLTIRFLADFRELVGEDLRIYGPFKKEDLVQLPERNAKILIEEHIAIPLNN